MISFVRAVAHKRSSSLMIDYRLSAVIEADVILVLSNEALAEKESHAELITLRGMFEKLSRLEVK